MPPDLVPTAMGRTAIITDTRPQGRGMEIEVAAGRRKGGEQALTGLKRIYHAEITEAPRDPDLLPGESRQIKTQQENASNSLGEIEVGPRR